jgi:hypothetical protein
MDLLSLLFTLAVVGFLLWIIVTYVPMPDAYRRAVIVLVVLLLVIWFVRIVAPGLFVVPRV